MAIKLRKLRGSAGLTHIGLAEQIRVRCPEKYHFSRGTIQRLEAGEIDPISPLHFYAHVGGCGADRKKWQAIYEEYRRELIAWQSKNSTGTSKTDADAVIVRRETSAPRSPRRSGSKLIMLIVLLVAPLLGASSVVTSNSDVRSRDTLQVVLQDGINIDLDQVPPVVGADTAQADLSLHVTPYSISINAVNGARVALWSNKRLRPSNGGCRGLFQARTTTLELDFGGDFCVWTSQGRTGRIHPTEMNYWDFAEMPTVSSFETIVWEK